MYKQDAKLAAFFVPFDVKGHPLDLTVARHVTVIHELITVHAQKKAQQEVVLGNVPSYRDLTQKGVGAYL